jgi:GNAT superfamily N-acetyltransferase
MDHFPVRRARASDLDGFTALARLFPAPTVPDENCIRTCFLAAISDPKAYIAVAVDPDGAIGGYLSGYRHFAFYAGGETAWCDEVLVREDRRRRGAGRQLMRGFELWATQNRCVLVSLATAGAKEFYQALGYAEKASYFKKYLSSEPA